MNYNYIPKFIKIQMMFLIHYGMNLIGKDMALPQEENTTQTIMALHILMAIQNLLEHI